MGRIVISENVSLDGVVQDPTGEEGFARGGWFLQVADQDREAWAKLEFDEARAAGAAALSAAPTEKDAAARAVVHCGAALVATLREDYAVAVAELQRGLALDGVRRLARRDQAERLVAGCRNREQLVVDRPQPQSVHDPGRCRHSQSGIVRPCRDLFHRVPVGHHHWRLAGVGGEGQLGGNRESVGGRSAGPLWHRFLGCACLVGSVHPGRFRYRLRLLTLD